MDLWTAGDENANIAASWPRYQADQPGHHQLQFAETIEQRTYLAVPALEMGNDATRWRTELRVFGTSSVRTK